MWSVTPERSLTMSEENQQPSNADATKEEKRDEGLLLYEIVAPDSARREAFPVILDQYTYTCDSKDHDLVVRLFAVVRKRTS